MAAHTYDPNVPAEYPKRRCKWAFRDTRYGDGAEDHLQTQLRAQDNRCALCLRRFTDELKPCLDHSHDTNKLRGALCSRCNAALGQFDEDQNVLKRAIEYLRSWS